MESKLYSLRGGLKKARKNKGIKQSDLADAMGVTLKTIMNWEQGIVNPDLATTMKLAKKLDCDIDYLTGRMTERTHDIKTACELTGLSEIAVEKIAGSNENRTFAKTLSRMIESEQFYNLITTYKIFLEFLEKLKADDLDDQLPWYELSGDNVVLGVNQAISHFKQEVSIAMVHLCEADYFKQASQVIQDVTTPFSASVEPGRITIHKEEE